MVRSGNSEGLMKIYEKAEAGSKELNADFKKLIQIIESLTKEHIRIFE